MILAKVLTPIIHYMNKFSIKQKVIALFLVLFISLSAQAIQTLLDYKAQHNLYKTKYQELSTHEKTYKLITKLQLHRGLLNSDLSKQIDLKKEIQESENDIKTFLKNNHFTKEQQEKIEALFIKNLDKHLSNHDIFQKHTQRIKNLIYALGDVTQKSFSHHDEKKASLLLTKMSNTLLDLQEQTGELRGIVSRLLLQDKISPSEQSQVLSLYVLIHTITQNNTDDPSIQTIISQYPEIKEKRDLMLYRLNNLLFIVKHKIINHTIKAFDSAHFFQIATDTIDAQYQLYKRVNTINKQVVQSQQQTIFIKMVAMSLMILTIIAASLYLSAGFYHSSARGIHKRKIVSHKISKGDTNIQIKTDSQDEISQALMAFNDMSDTINKNISFLNAYKHAIDEASIVYKTNSKGIITYVNQTFCDISGYTKEELIGKPNNIVRHPDTPKEDFKQLWQTIKAKKVWKGIVKNLTKDGRAYIVDATIMPIIDNKGEIVEYIAIRHDITQLQITQQQVLREIKKQKRDNLTSLANRLQLLEDSKQFKKPILLYLNIDHFAQLNDFYGPKSGDNTLRFIASLLQNRLENRQAHLYRLRSDEFLIVYEEEHLYTSIELLAQELIETIEDATMKADDKEAISITLSATSASYHDSDDINELLTLLSLAHRVAKNESKKFLVYQDHMNNTIAYEKNIQWVHKIKKALEEDRIQAFYQPIIDNKDGTIHKYESLMRFIEEDGKVVSPFFFLEIAKEAKLYTQLTKVMFDKTFETFKEEKTCQFSINITQTDILDTEVKSYILEKIQHFPYPENIILEITESEEIDAYDTVNEFITLVKKSGVQIAIDDFGSGYSNFDHIIKMNADFIKIDGSLIKNIHEDPDALIITKAIIAFSKQLHTKTIVEFVHNQEVYDKVREIGADYSQGFFLGEPAPTLVKDYESLSL